MMVYYEFTEREISALHRENSGVHYKRLNYIRGLGLEARIEAALKEEKK